MGTIAAVLGARGEARSDASRAREAFHVGSAEVASTLELAIQHEQDLVADTSAFVARNPSVSPADFDRWAVATRAMSRYPELQDIGIVALVPASRVKAFEAHMAANPIRPLGPNSLGPKEPFQILPAGRRPYYCFAVAGLERTLANYLPDGVDFCALAPTLMAARDNGGATYAPVLDGNKTELGVETPVYRGGVAPTTVAGRRLAFVGWLGELMEPGVVLARALQTHPNLAVTFHYNEAGSRIAFKSGHRPPGAQTTTIDLHNGWTVQTFAAAPSARVFAHRNAITVLLGGILLSVVVGLLVLVLATGRRRALSLVHEKTHELSQKNRELAHQALHDPLTGLPNRALVLDRAEQLIERTAPQRGVEAGALFIDVDGFKHVNDNYGHAAGDQLLRSVGERLRRAVREQDTVGRLGGDEFVVLSELRRGEATLNLLADRLTEVLREPMELEDGRKISSRTVSIGVAIGPYANPDSLLRDADLALYAAKAAGKDRYVLFDASMSSGEQDRPQLEADLRAAVQNPQEQFALLYQPIYELKSARIVGVEALIRWHHPQRKVVPPDSFIPLAEDTGLIAPIGRWVLGEACRQAAAWNTEGLRIGISVNVSAYQLGRRDFVEDVRRALAESAIEPSLLTLEITETMLMYDLDATRENLDQVKALGVRIAIDDFGTGYASLSQLRRLPVDILKIDRSFIAALNNGGWSRELLRASELLHAILGVSQALSLSVVAEGIEEQNQLSRLGAMGCEMGQGFFLGRPSPPQDISDLLASGGQPLADGAGEIHIASGRNRSLVS
ncbi:MAG TPA: EAL domain-containing protein [Solirubrobacteraceae bacterium]|nr:EAL domain-containing protein [Solirubrobacteraceae bacterium]